MAGTPARPVRVATELKFGYGRARLQLRKGAVEDR